MKLQLQRIFSRKHFSILCTLGLLGALIISSRHALAGYLAQKILEQAFAKEKENSISFSSACWNGLWISIENIQNNDPIEPIYIERIELKLGWPLHLFVIRPSWHVNLFKEHSKKSSSLSPLTLLKLIDIDIVEGSVSILHAKNQPIESIDLSLSSIDTHTLRLECYKHVDSLEKQIIEVLFIQKDRSTTIKIQTFQLDSLYLRALGALYPYAALKTLKKGLWDIEGEGSIDANGDLLYISAKAKGSHLFAETLAQNVQFTAETLEFAVLTTVENTINIDASLKEGTLHLQDRSKEYCFENLLGHLYWQTGDTPSFYLEGNFPLQTSKEKIVLSGEGELEENGEFSIRSRVLLGEGDHSLTKALLTITSGEEDHTIVDVEIEQGDLPFLQRIFEACKGPIENLPLCKKGTIRGSFRLLLQGKEPIRMELKPTEVSDLTISYGNLVTLHNIACNMDGRWDLVDKKNWHIRRFKGAITSEMLQYTPLSQLPLSNITGEILLQEEEIEESYIKANWKDIPIEIELEGTWRNPSYYISTSTLWSAFSSIFNAFGYVQNGHLIEEDVVECRIEVTPKMDEERSIEWELYAKEHLLFEGECTCKNGELVSGKFQTHTLPLSPLAILVGRHETVAGTLDGSGTFNRTECDALLFVNNLLLKDSLYTFASTSSQKLSIKWEKDPSTLFMQSHIIDGALTFQGAELSLHHLKGSLAWRPESRMISIHDLLGEIFYQNTPLVSLDCRPFTLHYEGANFHAAIHTSLKKQGRSIGQCAGKWIFSKNAHTFSLFPDSTYILGLLIQDGYITKKGDLCQSHIQGKLELETLKTLLHAIPLQDYSFISSWPHNIEGNLFYELSWNSLQNSIDLRCKTKDLHFGKGKEHLFSCSVWKEKEKVSIREWIFDEYKGHLQCSLEGTCPFSYQVQNPFFASQGSGSFFPKEKKLFLTPSLALFFPSGETIELVAAAPIAFHFQSEQGCYLDSVTWEEPLTRSTISTSKVLWDHTEKKLFLEKASFKLRLPFVQRWFKEIDLPSSSLEGTLSLRGKGLEFEILGNFKEGIYGWSHLHLPLKALQWRYIPGTFLLGARTNYEDLSFVETLQIDFKEKLALFKIQQPKETTTLQLLLNNVGTSLTPSVVSLTGYSSGVEASLQAVEGSPDCLKGTISIDMEELIAALPKKWRLPASSYGLGKKCIFEGILRAKERKTFYLQGTLSSNDLILWNRKLSSLYAHIEGSSDRVLIEKFSIGEKDFSLQIPRLESVKIGNNRWQISLPILQMKNFNPSVLQKIGTKSSPIKPFTIRNLTARHLQGILGEKESFVCSCEFQFTNREKKEKVEKQK